MPSRTEVIERLRARALASRSHGDGPLANLAEQAADLLAGESRTEYRVAGENLHGQPYETATPIRDLNTAEANLRGWKTGGALSGRIQKRTITESPWIDVEGEDRG